ncbi:MAG: hypothetical protein V4598_03550 [Bdellovibrionota bacterium]
MKILFFVLILASCSHAPTQHEEEQLIRDVAEINSTVNDLTYAVHKPLYNIPESE